MRAFGSLILVLIFGLQARAVRAGAPGVEFFGLAIQVDSSHKPVERYGRMIHEIADLGANSVLFSVNGYQENAGSTQVFTRSEKTPDDEQWRKLFAAARQRGLKVLFMPKILLSEPRGDEWRGVIDPGHGWDEWFEQYGKFVLHYARLAAEGGVDVFVVGSELASTEKHTQRWKKLIAQVRSAFPAGRLTYSANWDHYENIRFWDDLDLLAITSYFKTAEEPEPKIAELVASWKKHKRAILDWQRTIAKPVLFTEVGWCSQEGCSVEPWNYYRRQASSVEGLEEQRRNYEAFIHTWREQDNVAGAIWWEWTPGEGGAADHGYSPKNKPAQVELYQWFREQRAMPSRTEPGSSP